VAFDVGANIGIWTLLAAGRGARVHAFEPVPELVERLRAHVALNGADNVLVNSFAAGAESGSLPFFAVRKDNRGASGFARPSAPSEEIRVPVETLDAYVARRGITRVDVMKVDVEGAELLVFRGARALLSSPSAPALFFEVGEVLCARNGTTPRQLKQFLVDCGYRIYRWQRGAFAAVTVEERHDHEDLFALKTS
jgi:FkbM family methyltransferase